MSKAALPRAFLRDQGGTDYAARFAPTGDRIVTTADDRTARIWDAETGEELAVFPDHDHLVVAGASFNPSGTRVLSYASRDARLWAEDGAELLRLQVKDDPSQLDTVGGVTWSPDGLTVAAWRFIDTVHLFRAIPWRSNDLPGTADMELGERVRLWRDRGRGPERP